MGICGSRLRTCSARPRQSLNVIPSFSARAWTAAHIWSHVVEGSLRFLKEGRQSPVIVELVVIHHFMHLLPCGVSFRVEVAGHGLTFCLRDSIPQNS